jgi:hypothetical protein
MNAPSRLVSSFLTLILTLSPGLSPIAHAQATDFKPPKVVHSNLDARASSTLPHVISATVSDESGIDSVKLFYRNSGASEYKEANLLPTGTANLYMTELPAAALSPPSLEYYIQAEDKSGNIILKGFSFEPLVLSVFKGSKNTVVVKKSTEDNNSNSLASNKLLWIGLGVLAIGGIAASAGGGGGGSSDNVFITAPKPQ